MAFLVHYLLVYDHSVRRLLEHRPFENADEAVEAYAVKEQDYHDDTNMEIVLVSAENLDVIRKTHGHYFAPAGAPLKMPLQMPPGLQIR